MHWALVLLATSWMPASAQGLSAVPATQLPQGGKVLGGAASITQSTGNMQVNQTTPRAVIEWNSFNLGSKAQVNFVQPTAGSVALNRVLDTQASQILGRIQANGQVFISNPNGVLFGPTAQVDVGGLLVTTHGISTEDFMGGKSSFQGSGQAAGVANQGELRASLGGFIAMLAPQVRNEGVILAKEGTVALAAGEKITLQFSGQSLTAVQVDRAVVDALVDNRHLVRAEGGWVVMTARSANALLQSVVKSSGTVQAPSLVSRQGRIILEGGSVGRVEVTGELSATGGAGLPGGSVWVTGDQVTLGNAARVDVSGDTAGGQALIGGGWPESVGPLAKSSEVSLGEGASIKAMANGVGNGGFVETSARKVQIAATAKIDTSAPNGKPGQWVIDPVDIDINASLASAISTALNSGDVLVSTDSGNTPSTASGETSGVGNISVNSPISWSSNRLTLKAANNLYVNQVLRGSGTASLRFHMTSSEGIDRVYVKAPIYLPEGNTLSAVDGPAGNIDFNVITRLGSAGSTTGTDLQGINGNLNGYYALGDDIDAAATSLWNGGAGFMPIGNSVTPFAGALTGLGHVISNLTINRPTSDSVGLFGRSVGVLSELGIVNASIVGANQVGTLVGNNAGYTTTNFATGSVTGQSSVGGLMGVLDGYGSARNSYAKTNVSVSSNADAGGLIGLVKIGTVYKTYSSGSVTNLGSGAPSGVGGLIGRLGTGVQAPVDVSVAGFWDTTLSGQTTSAAGVGLDTASTMRWSSLSQFNLNTNEFWLNYYGKSAPLLKPFLTPLTITASNASKTYDGLAYAGAQGFSTSVSTNSYLMGADTVSYGGSAATAVNAGSYAIVPSGLYSNDNRGYAISYANGTLTIQKADLTLSGTRPYDGSTVMAGAYLTANGVNGETFSVVGDGAAGNLSTRNVQTAQPMLSSTGLALGDSSNGGLSSNYNTLGISGSSVTITPKSVTLTAPTASKVYDGTVTYVASADDLATLGSQLGVAGDTVSGPALSFQNKNAGLANKVLSLSAATVNDGNSGQNYAISYASNNISTITPKALTISGITVADKVYDGTATAAVSTAGVTASVLQANGMVAGDDVQVSASGNFRNAGNTANDKNVGNGKTVQLSSSYSGTDVDNYSITGQASTTASITPKALMISGITAADKVYDGTASAVLDTSLLQGNGLVAGDDVRVSASGNFRNAGNTANDKNVGNAKTVQLSSSYSGADVDNYSITGQASTTASITPKALTISGITAADKVYDGTATAAVSTAGVTASVLQANGMVAGDDVQVSASGNFRNAGNTANDKNVGNAKTVQLSSSYSGTDVGNYRITGQATTAASVTARPLDVTGLVPNDKTYDGSTDATLTGTAQIGVFSNDDVSLQIGTAQFENPAVGNLIPIATQGFKLNGADAKNYQLNQPAGMRASITAIDLTLVQLNLSAQSMALLTKQQMAGLTPEQVSYLTDVQFGALSQAQLTSLSPQVWSKVSVANVANLPPEKIAVIGPEAWRNWSVNQIQSLTPTQIQSMTPGQIAGWQATQLQALSERQVASLGGTLLQALSDNQWQALSPTQIKTLSPNQLSAVSSTQLASWTPAMVAGLSSEQVASLNVGQVKSLRKEQLDAMTLTQWQALSQAQIAAIPPQQIATLKPSTLATWSSPQIAALDSAQMRSLNSDHLAALSQPQMMQLAATGQLQVIVSSDIAKVQVAAGLPAVGMQTAPLSSFGESAPNLNAEPLAGSSVAANGTPARMNAMPSAYKARSVAETQPLMVVTSSRQITQFDGTEVAALKPAQIKLMNGPQIDALLQSHGRDLQPAQWAHFSAAQISTISPVVWATLGREVIQGLTPQQLAELTPPQFASMTNNQLQWLSPLQIGALQRRSLAELSPEQFNALAGQKLQALEPRQIQTATPSQWVSLSPNQMRSLTLHQMPALGPALLNAMTPEQWAMLSPEQIKLLSPQSLASIDARQLAPVLKQLLPDQIGALDAQTLAGLENRHLFSLGMAQWGALLPKQVAALSESQINALQPSQIRSLADDAMSLLTNETVSKLSPAVLSAMTPAQWQNLTTGQVQALQRAQLAALDPAQYDLLGARVLQGLSAEQLGSLTLPQRQAIQALNDASRNVPQLTPAQIGAMQAKQLQDLSLPQWKAFSPGQIQSIQPQQWLGLDSAVLRNLRPAQLAALRPEQARALQPSALAALAPAQLQAVSPQALGALVPEQWAALSGEQLAALSPRRLAGLGNDWLAKLQPRQLQALSPDQLSGLAPSQWASLPPGQMSALAPSQMGGISPQALAQMSPMQLNGLTPGQMASLQPHQMSALTGPQIKVLQPQQLQALQAGQIAALQPAQLNALTPPQVRALMPQQLYQIAPVHIIALSPSVIQWLSPAQWSALRPEVMAVLQAEQIQALRPALIAALTPSQLSALKSSQVRELAKEQVAALGAGQLWSLSNAQLHALTPGQVSAVRSVPLGSLLPLLRAEQIQGLDRTTLAMINPIHLRQLSNAQVQALTSQGANAGASLPLSSLQQRSP